jgi:hypothetical protein
MTEYKDMFTLDGRIKPVAPYVTAGKVKEADRLLKAAFQGDKIAAGKLAEVHTTSDLQFNLAHLITVTTLPQFDAAPRTWSEIATVRTVPDFGPVRLQSLYGDLTGAGVHANGGLLDVPEGAPYPYVTVSGREAFYAKISKKGAKFGFTWEAGVNDVVGFFESIPGELLQLALDTEEREVYEAITTGATNELAGGTLPDGTVVPVNAPVSPNAIWQAIIEASNKEVNGRKVGRSATGYNVLVPIGVKDFVDWKLNQTVISIVDGDVTLGPGDRSALNGVTVIESEYITGTAWYLLPKKNGVRRPVVELARLRGYETPELRVHGNTGNYVGGSAVSPFEGNIDNDTIDYRVRYVVGGILWDDTYIVYSEGDGTA